MVNRPCLTEEQEEDLCADRRDGMTQRVLAERYGCSRGKVCDVLERHDEHPAKQRQNELKPRYKFSTLDRYVPYMHSLLGRLDEAWDE